MGSVEKRVRDGRTTFLARWREPDGRQRKRSFRRKIDADRWLVTVESSKLAGRYVDPDAGRLTVGTYAASWLERQAQLRPGTKARYGDIVRVHIDPAFGMVPLARLERSTVAAWVAELTGAGLAGPTVRHIHRVLTMILNSAVADGRLARNVAARVPVPRARGREKRFLSHAEVAALAEAAGADGIIIRVLAYTGLRFGELAALRVCCVDMRRRRLQIMESVTEVGGKMIFGPPKSGVTRSVPFPRSLADELEAACAGKAPEAPVFTAPEGGVLRLHNWRHRVFGPATRAAGLDGLTPHSLRHTAASLAVSAGANVKHVQRMLGHASAAMTLDIYSGLFDDDLDGVADRLDEAATKAKIKPSVPPVCPEDD